MIAPLGILIASALQRRWRELMIVGITTAVITAPYTLHVLRYAGWYSEVRNYSALLFDPMLDVLGLLGLIAALKHPRAHVIGNFLARSERALILARQLRFLHNIRHIRARVTSSSRTRWERTHSARCTSQ